MSVMNANSNKVCMCHKALPVPFRNRSDDDPGHHYFWKTVIIIQVF